MENKNVSLKDNNNERTWPSATNKQAQIPIHNLKRLKPFLIKNNLQTETNRNSKEY